MNVFIVRIDIDSLKDKGWKGLEVFEQFLSTTIPLPPQNMNHIQVNQRAKIYYSGLNQKLNTPNCINWYEVQPEVLASF